jgi:hypothetical protein
LEIPIEEIELILANSSEIPQAEIKEIDEKSHKIRVSEEILRKKKAEYETKYFTNEVFTVEKVEREFAHS